MTSWFAGQLLPGERSSQQPLQLINPTNDTLSINVKPQKLSLILKNNLMEQQLYINKILY